MFRKSKDEQISIFDRYLTANKQTSKAVDNSVAKLVGDIIYPNVDEERFAPLFSSDNNSRPNIEIRRYVSALILKRLYRMSDANLIEFLRCGAVNFQYALHTTGQDLQPLSEVSLYRFRAKILDYKEERVSTLSRMNFCGYPKLWQRIWECCTLIPVRMTALKTLSLSAWTAWRSKRMPK